MRDVLVRLGFRFLLAWQTATAVINVALAKWDWVLFDMACMAIVMMSWVLTERSLRGIETSKRGRQERVAHFKSMLDASRRVGDEQSEQYALTMLSIWGWKGE